MTSFRRASIVLGAIATVVACGNAPQLVVPLEGDAGPTGTGGGAVNEASTIIIKTPDASVFQPDADDQSDGATTGDGAGIGSCGDGEVQPPETCDDGNSAPGDGCSGICTIENGYKCPTPGQVCVFDAVCGNGKIEGEACDDANTISGDGCSATCEAEPGWACVTVGQPCVKLADPPRCGDGAVNAGEECDDGDNPDAGNANGDGCSSTCKREPGWNCPQPGQPCVKIEFCGDGVVQSGNGEECDDGNGKPADGCSGICKLEAGYICPDPGIACTRIWICGNGKIDPTEACDDGNTVSSDGCAADCTYVEAGFTCPKALDGTGGQCTIAPQNTCGDAMLGPSEECDDGNKMPTDGCSDICEVEPGWTCPTPGMACKKIAFCSDGIVSLVLGEECDDGNLISGDGCSLLCKREPNFSCPPPPTGGACTSTVVCGDGKVAGTEQCDDANLLPGDGCGATCQLEAGWICPIAGIRCVAKTCGDGIIAGTEQCDDQNPSSNDGCSSTCKLEPGFACVTTNGKSVCHATVCGDGTKEGFEECDDGNLIPFDGCTGTCTLEPQCTNGQCTPVCGDGKRYATEACDDGNTRNGDGCSSTCTIEVGYTCADVPPAQATTVTLPVVYRDFVGAIKGGDAARGAAALATARAAAVPPVLLHPDFNVFFGGGTRGVVQNQIGVDDRPVYVTPNNPGEPANFTGQANFNKWYHNDPAYNRVVVGSVVLTLNAGLYVYDSGAFFGPVDNKGFVPGLDAHSSCCNHNFSFTSETHFWFEYAGGEKFDFSGDDDVWVFVNGKLVIDLGGLHSRLAAGFTLDATMAQQGVAHDYGDLNNTGNIATGMVFGGVYEVAMFHAEREENASNFKLTLKDFNKPKSQCTPICGDGKVVGDEVCDDGVNNGAYGSCLPGCKGRGGYCGDSIVQNPPETCDNGTNLVTYGGTTQQCGPGCKWAPYCGDGVASNAEECDEAGLNGTGYGHCTAACKLGPRCGDGVVNGPEKCDNGINNGSSADKCTANCTLKCGDGVKDPGEQCDNGAANALGYGKCSPTCTIGPRCGDGVVNGPETCDDGKNDGSYGTCKSDCTVADYCGDGKLTNPPEICDVGAQNSASAYGKTLCTNACKPAPYCGDKAVDGTFGEICDDGVNSGQPGSCTPDCKGFVPLPSCGDGTVKPPEQCDDAVANGTMASTCDTHCRFKCGNGIKDASEQCDNGVNDGSYGTCKSNCTFAGYCGDNLKNGPEQCDNGTSGNVSPATAYGKSICTSACTWAPFCGDGRVQAKFNEECDSSADCDANCKKTSVQ